MATYRGNVSQVTGLRANPNKYAVTVLDLFLDAVDEFGMPSRMRGDRGPENVAVATYITVRNGSRRASFIWGP